MGGQLNDCLRNNPLLSLQRAINATVGIAVPRNVPHKIAGAGGRHCRLAADANNVTFKVNDYRVEESPRYTT